MKKNKALAIQIVTVVTNVLSHESIRDQAVDVVEELLDEAFKIEVKVGSTVEVTDRYSAMVGKTGRVLDIFVRRDGTIMVEIQFKQHDGSVFSCAFEDVRVVT